jgi:putative glutamine amidotransferase
VLLKKAMDDAKPFLGTCRSCQLLNVGLSGTLYDHIADALPGALQHDQPEDRKASGFREVLLEDGARIARIAEQSVVRVSSHHHQGAKDLGRGARALCRTGDGPVEAIELPDHPVGLAVQWHPEWLPSQAHARALFREFTAACRRPAARSAA